jgi:hypothetical protein
MTGDFAFSFDSSGEFATELAVMADVLFTPGAPPDPKPSLAALMDKPEWMSPLSTTYRVAEGLLGKVHVVDPPVAKLDATDSLVAYGLSNIWRVDEAAVRRVTAATAFIESTHTPPPLDIVDFLPMILFVVGLSSVLSFAFCAPMPGDPIREAVGL